MTAPADAPPTRAPGDVAPWRTKLVTLVLSLVATLLAAEILVRVFAGTPMRERLPILRVQANPHRGWEMVPGEWHHTYLHRVAVNSLGLRGREVGARAPGEVRVLTLGDSLLYGQGVADDQTIAYHLEAILQRQATEGTSYRVINGGLRAYATHQQLAMLEELGPVLRPDVVVVFWYWNDLYQERDIQATYERLAREGPIAFDTNAPLVGRTRLEWHLKQIVRRSALVMWLYDLVRHGRGGQANADVGFLEPGFVKLDDYLDGFLRLQGELGVELLFAIVPDPNAVAGEHFTRAVDDRAEERMRAKGLRVVRLLAPLEALREERGELPILPYDGHYDGEGNRAIAERVATELLESER